MTGKPATISTARQRSQPRPKRSPPLGRQQDHGSRPAPAQPRDRASRSGDDPSQFRAEPFTQAEWESNPWSGGRGVTRSRGRCYRR